jgi:hypothetical protein
MVFGGGVAVEGEELRDALLGKVHSALFDMADRRAADADDLTSAAHRDSARPAHPS